MRRALERRALRLQAERHLASALVAGRISRDGRAVRRNRAGFYRSMWTSAAEETGASVRPGPGDALAITAGGTEVVVRETSCSIDGGAVRELCGDKPRVYRMLAETGVPVPAHALFTLRDLGVAERLAAATGGPVVVKPARDTGGGRGVTTGLLDRRDIGRAAALAAAEAARAGGGGSGSPVARLRRMRRDVERVDLIVEEQVAGHNYRLLYLDGVLVDAVRRGAPRVVGDGASSVDALIGRLNGERLREGGQRGQWLVTRDLDLDRTLAAQGLTRSSVPPAGAVVTLKTVVNQNDPASNHPARAEVCEAVVRLGAAAAQAVGARLAGVDIITADPSVPLAESGGRVLEVNTTPGFAIHLNGHPGAVNPATALLRHLAGSEVATA